MTGQFAPCPFIGVACEYVPKADEVAELRAEIERLQKELDRRIVDGIHTCHDECPRLLCVARRENERLRQEVKSLMDELGYHGVYPK